MDYTPQPAPHIARIRIAEGTYQLLDRIRRLRVATGTQEHMATPSNVLEDKIKANWSAIYNDLVEEHNKLLQVAQGVKALVTEKLRQGRRYMLAVEVSGDSANMLEKICADRFALGADPLLCRPSAILEEILSGIDFDTVLGAMQADLNTQFALMTRKEIEQKAEAGE